MRLLEFFDRTGKVVDRTQVINALGGQLQKAAGVERDTVKHPGSDGKLFEKWLVCHPVKTDVPRFRKEGVIVTREVDQLW